MSNLMHDAAASSQAQAWVLRLASGEIEPAEIDRFKAWLAEDEAHARAFDHRRALWLALGEHPEVFEPASAPRRARVRGAVGRPGGARRRAAYVATAAAAVLAVLVLPEATLRLQSDHRTTNAVAAYLLPDGSTAWLDADSAISVRFDGRQREIALLRGSAWFDVRHGDARPFRVAALDGVIEDIGTRFEVKRAPGRVAVVVSQGAVRVTPSGEGAGAVLLRQGQGVDYDAAGVLRRREMSALGDIAAWRRSELMIDRRSLPEAIGEIARYRRGPTWIWGDISDSPPINGAFRLVDPDAALRDLAMVHGLSVTWLPAGVAIVRRPEAAR